MTEKDRKSRESDAKGAVEEDNRKIAAIDADDAFGNEHASGEHTGQQGKREEEEN